MSEVSAAVIMFGVFLLVAVLSAVFARIAKGIALRYNIVSHPGMWRHSRHVTPLLGGVAIFFSFWAGILILFFVENFGLDSRSPGVFDIEEIPKLIGLFAGSLLLFVTGLIDDIKPIRARYKMLIQAFAVVILIGFGFTANLIYLSNPLSIFLTFMWILLIINAFNLLDNVDGLSAGIAIITGSMFLMLAYFGGNFSVFALVVVFIASVAGFFPYNKYRAKMFMGDSGSLFLGYVLAGITLMISAHQTGANLKVAVLAPILMFAVPIYDTLSVIIIRRSQHRSIFLGDTNHLSHRLLALGITEKMAVYLMYLMTLSTALLAILLTQVDMVGAIIIFTVYLSMTAIIAVLEYNALKKMRSITGKV